MTIHHHPGDETLLRLAAGMLGAGPALVVSVHLEGCALCRAHVSEFEVVGGALLEDMPPAALAVDLFGRTIERLEEISSAQQEAPVRGKQPALGMEYPHAMRHCEVGPWRWLAPGFQRRKIRIAGCPDAKVMLLKGRAGLHLPAHGHVGVEFMQILSGSLSDERGQYFPGDLDEAGEEVDHQPVVGTQSECICLAALEGSARLHGLLGRLLSPLVGF